jgi:hypothetical protein
VREDGAANQQVLEWQLEHIRKNMNAAIESGSDQEIAMWRAKLTANVKASQAYDDNDDDENEEEENEGMNDDDRQDAKKTVPDSFCRIPPAVLRVPECELDSLESFPLLRRAKRITFNLEKGEALYLPACT